MQKSKRSDSELVQMALEGNLEAFDAIVRRYQDAVYATALHRTGNFADAQDIAQEAFLAAYINLSKLRDPSKLASWLRTITLYTYNHWRRKHPDMEMLDAHGGSALVGYGPSRPDEIVEQQELRQRVLAGIASLPRHTGEVVTLYYIDGLSYQDIAEFLSLSTTTVKGRLQMGRKRLREELVGMMEGTLKQNRPDSRFSESVLEAIVQRARQARKDNAHDELLQACDEALEVMQRMEDTETKKRMGMDILCWRADELFHWLGKPEEAAASWEEAAQLAGELDMRDERARWLLMAGITHWHHGQHAAMKPYAQQAKAIYQQLDNLPNQAMCDALIDLCELLPTGWQRTEDPNREIKSGYAAYVFPLIRSSNALTWDWKERPPTPFPTHHLISIKLRRGWEARGIDMTFGRIVRPAKWMERPPHIGQTWDDEITTSDGEDLPVHTTVVSLTDTVVTPAGRFENCLRLESRIIEPEDADMSQQMKVFRRRERTGLRILWFAPGVGLVKAHYENENSKYALYQVTEYDVVEETNDHFPLHPGNGWSYQWYIDLWRLLFTERCRVAGCREDTWYLTSACYSDPLDEKAQCDYLERLHQLEHDSGNLRGEVWTLNALHNIHARLGDMDRATILWEEQESLCTVLEDQKLHYALLMCTDYEHHSYERIPACYEQAAAVARAVGDQRRESEAWTYLADAALRRRDYTRAADAAQKAVTILEEVDEGEALAVMIATLDVSRILLHAPDAGQNVGFWRIVLYQEGEELLLHNMGGVGSGGFSSGVDSTCEYRINPPSFDFLLGAPLLKEPYKVGVSWTDYGRERAVEQRIAATDAAVDVPAGVFERCLLVEAQIRCRVERKGSHDADMRSEMERGFQEGTIRVWFAQGHGMVQMDYHHRNGQRTLVQLTGQEIQESDESYFPLQPGNVWYYDWTNEKGEMLIHEMYRVLPKRGDCTYIAASAYAVHSDYAG